MKPIPYQVLETVCETPEYLQNLGWVATGMTKKNNDKGRNRVAMWWTLPREFREMYELKSSERVHNTVGNVFAAIEHTETGLMEYTGYTFGKAQKLEIFLLFVKKSLDYGRLFDRLRDVTPGTPTHTRWTAQRGGWLTKTSTFREVVTGLPAKFQELDEQEQALAALEPEQKPEQCTEATGNTNAATTSTTARPEDNSNNDDADDDNDNNNTHLPRQRLPSTVENEEIAPRLDPRIDDNSNNYHQAASLQGEGDDDNSLMWGQEKDQQQQQHQQSTNQPATGGTGEEPTAAAAKSAMAENLFSVPNSFTAGAIPEFKSPGPAAPEKL